MENRARAIVSPPKGPMTGLQSLKAVCLALLMWASTTADAIGASPAPDDCQRDVRCTVGAVLDLLSKREAGIDRYRLPAYGYVAMTMSMSGAPAEEMNKLYAQIRSEIAVMKQIPNSIDQMVAYIIIDDFLSSPEPSALQTVASELNAEVARRNEQMRHYGTMSPLCKASFTLLSGEVGYDPAMRQRVVAATRNLPDCRDRIDRAFAEQDHRSGIAFDKVFVPDGDSFTPRNKNYRHYRDLLIAFGGRDQTKADAIAQAWLDVSRLSAQRGSLLPENAVWNAMVLSRAGYEDKAEELLALADVDELRENDLTNSLKMYLSASLMDQKAVTELMRPNIIAELDLDRREARGFTTIDDPANLPVVAARLMLALDLDPNGWEE